MKKIFTLVLAFYSLSAWAYDFSVNGIYYEYLEGKNVEVTYRGDDYNSYKEYYGAVTIPTSVTHNRTTYSVTKIGDYAFNSCTSLTSVTIPESVTSIGDYAFAYCSSLASVTIPESVTSIGKSAFKGCSAIDSIVWNAKNCADAASLEDAPFYAIRSQITSFTFDKAVEHIPAYLCYRMEKLTSITIPNSVISIGVQAFCGCSFTSVTIPNSVTSIGDEAFCGCSSLTSVTIPNSVTSISEGAFRSCSSLTSITIPNSVTSIGNYAFAECSSLTSITIPNSVTSIGARAFQYCSSLTSITIPNSVTSIGDYAFYRCSALTSITIPESVTSIGEHAFEDCFSLTSITIPNSVTSIGDWAFSDCSKLTSITIPNSVTSIGWYAFFECTSLTSITIPNSVTSIGDWAFYRCSALTSITIPESVTSIGNSAFDDCSALKSIVWNARNCADASSSSRAPFYGITSQIKSFTFGDAVEHIPAYLCYRMEKLTSITIPNSVTSIGLGAFQYCSSLTSITIPNSVTSIGNYAFAECSSLTSITIPNSVTSIGARAFQYCSSLTSITIPNSVTSIGNSAFAYCSSLTSITCEAATPPTLGSYVFNGVSKSIPVYVPCGRVDAYKAVEDWKDFTNIQEPLAEYLIEVNVNDNIMGTAKVDRNSACGNQISATPNFGYHFVQWNDGNTDNPRSLELTQDITLIAEFALNQYTVTTLASHNERGTTEGDTTVNYLESITISATANYGYHFVQWNDGNTENPRQVKVTDDKIYTAYFDKNTYYVTKNYDSNQGYVNGSTSGEYLDNITLTAKPNYGYHFVRWEDGNTDNPRTLILTQDTTLTAEFARTVSGQCGDNLYWAYNESDQRIAITGTGDMYNYTSGTQPWLLFKEQIVEVTITNTVTSIGTSAFEGCARLGKISLGTGLEEIAADAFAGCTRLYDIYTYATYPPFAEESSFANYNVYVYVPCEYQRGYTLDVVWGKFKFIECIDSEEATTDGNVTIVPGYNDVTITWPTEGNADTYTIIIKRGSEVFCTLTFNADGQLLNIAFAPSRDGKNHPAQYAVQTVSGYRFTVTGLEEGTHYTYNIDVRDIANKTINSHAGEFTTQSITAVDNIQSPVTTCQKLLRNGQLLILRDGVEYNAMGQEL